MLKKGGKLFNYFNNVFFDINTEYIKCKDCCLKAVLNIKTLFNAQKSSVLSCEKVETLVLFSLLE